MSSDRPDDAVTMCGNGEAEAPRTLPFAPPVATSAADLPRISRPTGRPPMAAQYIFQMQGLTKAYPGGKKVFENIWLS
ncbi:MAG TPA: hypothetical protein PLE81_11410, partial [Brevundimonas sp.]|nr:hypothetical protein [Brevundimonas sp.]